MLKMELLLQQSKAQGNVTRMYSFAISYNINATIHVSILPNIEERKPLAITHNQSSVFLNFGRVWEN